MSKTETIQLRDDWTFFKAAISPYVGNVSVSLMSFEIVDDAQALRAHRISLAIHLVLNGGWHPSKFWDSPYVPLGVPEYVRLVVVEAGKNHFRKFPLPELIACAYELSRLMPSDKFVVATKRRTPQPKRAMPALDVLGEFDDDADLDDLFGEDEDE